MIYYTTFNTASSEKKHSNELATMDLMDCVISALYDKYLLISLLMDLSKAFDIFNTQLYYTN